MPTSSFQSTRLNRAPINGLKNTTPIESMRHLDIKPRQPMQHKGFFRHTPSGMVLKKKGDEQLTALQTTFRRENLSLAGCSSAEPASVSVQQYKIQISKLYLQPVEIPSHFQDELIQSHNQLMKEWKQRPLHKDAVFIKDGIINIDKWLAPGNKEILLLLKEAYGEDSDWDL